MLGWLLGWRHRCSVTIDSAVVDAPLTDFPVLLYVSASSGKAPTDLSPVFDEIGASSKKIAVTTSDGVTQCPVEIEEWDSGSEKAWLWVKAPTVASAADTVLYLYYDSLQPDNDTYVGDVNSAVGASVWDGSFVLVDHMQDYGDTSSTVDSTSNDNDGVKAGAAEPAQGTGKIGYGQTFDGTDDRITLPDVFPTSACFEFWIKHNEDGDGTFIDQSDGNNAIKMDFADKEIYCSFDSLAAHKATKTIGDAWSQTTGEWRHLAVSVPSGGAPDIYINGVEPGYEYNNALGGDMDNIVGSWYLGDSESQTTPFKGVMDEFRFSNSIRSAAWLKASYHSGADTLITYGTEQESPTDNTLYYYPRMWKHYYKQKEEAQRELSEKPPDPSKVDWTWKAVEQAKLNREIKRALGK